MNMLQHLRTAPTALRISLTLVGLLAVSAGTAAGGEHTDFPDLSIQPDGSPRLPRVPAGGVPKPTVFDIISFIDEGEGTGGANHLRFPAPTFNPVPQTPAFVPNTDSAGAVAGSNFSAIPTPGASGLMLIGLALAARRRR
ncbi:MAG: hypothetical protein ACKVZJ_03340 [Phycisphaerales bacterium]